MRDLIYKYTKVYSLFIKDYQPARLRRKIGKIYQGRGIPQSFFGGQWGLSDPQLLPPDQLQRQL